jgi:hypothetical protein
VIRFRRAFGVGAVVIAPAATSVATATAQSSKDAPKATEIGVTANEIHIAVVADVDNRWRRACSRARLQG